MSLPNYLAKIKSAGIYRFVWDKSVVPPQQAETLRMLIGYSEKGPFNTPVYIDNIADFKTIYGNISKRLEKRGVYFHRMAEQALQAGPILALNLKPFTTEAVSYLALNGNDFVEPETGKMLVAPKQVEGSIQEGIYDTNRFWKLDADLIAKKIKSGKYFNIVATDTKETSCSIVVRPVVNGSYSGITFKSWYLSQGVDMPEYLEPIADECMDDYFAEIYVFRGEFTEAVKTGSLAKYFKDGYIDPDYVNTFGQKTDALAAMASDSNSNFIGVYSGCTIPNFKDANGNYISLDIKFNSDHNSHKMLMQMDESVLENVEVKIENQSNNGETIEVEIGKDEQLKEILKIKNTEASASDVTYTSPIYLPGYTYGSMEKDVNIYAKCISVLSDERGIREALTNRVDVEYHYIIDTFDSTLTNNKAELFALAKEKDNTFVIANFPKMSTFVNIGAEVQDETGAFDMKAAMAKFTMPGESEGASFGAYYTQLTFSDGTVKTVVPSAALVSNNFMQKWGPRQPYYIVAGPNYGALTYSGLVGPDYNFSRADLDVLEPKGINAIIYVPRLGTYISSNQTAKQIPVSGLSKVHIRELVIYLQNEIEHLLQSYQWELNTQTLRDTIKSKADVICDTIKNNGGIYEFINICDETNNTPEVIDNEMIILDTEIEPARGAGKMVHQLTIHKTGGLTSSVK